MSDIPAIIEAGKASSQGKASEAEDALLLNQEERSKQREVTEKTGKRKGTKRPTRKASSETPTGTVTFLFTDIEGSTVLWENYPTQMQEALTRHDEILRAAVEASGGYVFKTVGDAFCAAFATAEQALQATLAAQRALFAEEWPENVVVRVRMALHTGVAEEGDGDYFGPPVNRVARLLSTGHGGQILLSDATYNLVRDVLVHMEPGAQLRDLGEHRLKDLRYTERIFQLVVPDLPADFPPLKTHGLVTPTPGLSTPTPPATGPSSSKEASRKAVPREDRYTRKKMVGSGGMAEVYLAHDEVLDRDVALKVLRKQYADDEQFVERFKREAKNAASLSHSNIVAVHDRGETEDGAYYIVMECMPGGTLKERIEEGPLPASEAVELTLQIAKALEAAHRRGVIHRDIKPQNVLLSESGEAKVADFGIARAASSTTITKTGGMLGTPHYVSPEVAQGGSASPQSDLYSLGVVLYEMLTGTLPYDAETPVGVVMKHVSERLRPPKEVKPEVPEGINAVCERLLAKDPEDRYQSASELIEDLERVRRGSLPAFVSAQQQEVSSGAASTLVEDEVGMVVEPPEGRGSTVDSEGAAVGPALGGVGSGESRPRQDAKDSPVSQEAVTGPERARPPHTPVSSPSGNKTRILILAGVVGALLLLLGGGAAMALTGIGPGASLFGVSERPSVDKVPPAESSDAQNDTAAQEEDTKGTSSPASSSSTITPPSSSDSAVPEEYADKEKIRQAVKDYYEAVDHEDWDYTYDNLDSQTRQMFTKQEWKQKNQWFADNVPQELSSLDIDVKTSPSEPVANVRVNRTFKDGSSLDRDTYFVFEDSSWKHRFSQEEIDTFMPGASFEEFVKAHQGDSSKGPSQTTKNQLEKAAVEKAIRDHYAAIGAGDFERAYSYFGPTEQSVVGGRENWIAGEKASKITGSTINSLKVEKVSDNTATATVDVSFKDKTGTPRFLITWDLVKEGGSWKLDSQESGNA